MMSLVSSAFLFGIRSTARRREASMRNNRVIKALVYILVSLTLTLNSCGGESGGTAPRNTGVRQVEQFSKDNGRTATLRTINITPINPLGINVGTRLQFASTGSYSDNSVQDLTTLVVWNSSDISVATISNAPDSKGQAIAVSRGYCSISASLDSITASIVIGVN